MQRIIDADGLPYTQQSLFALSFLLYAILL